MAMTTQTRTESRQRSLRRRIRRFYDLLNDGDFGQCYQMIDPFLRSNPNSVTLFQYENSLREFLHQIGSIDISSIAIDLHLDQPSKLYGDRDFAVGETIWANKAGEPHSFSERWVWDEQDWYTRCTGLLAPTPQKISIPLMRTNLPTVGKQARPRKRNT
jgi:hypothetical protein